MYLSNNPLILFVYLNDLNDYMMLISDINFSQEIWRINEISMKKEKNKNIYMINNRNLQF